MPKQQFVASRSIDQLKHGKVLLHKNLLIAKVNDVRLKAHLIKAYQESKTVVFLPNDYLALPVAMKPELERLRPSVYVGPVL